MHTIFLLATLFVKTEIRSGALVANLYQPANVKKAPAVMLIGGSGGGIGWQDEIAQLLANRGYATLAVAYFGMADLPKNLEHIPLEYFDVALTQLRLQPFVDPERIGIVAVSKGSEVALLFASMRPEIHALVGFAPSAVLWPSIGSEAPSSSWSYRGKDLPYVPYGKADSKVIADFYRAGLAQAGAALDPATIHVENIKGPILLLTGREDNLWPSTAFADMVTARLKANAFAYPFEHVAYPDAGHLISNIRKEDVSRRGGSEQGNRDAQVDAQRRMIEFLDRSLKPTTAGGRGRS